MMQTIVDMLQILAVGATALLVVMLLVTLLRLRKIWTTTDRLVRQIEEGKEL